jgi:hypothetical protein
MSLEIKKLYVDSRYRTADSKSDSDFRIQLGRNISLPENCVMRVENVQLSHSWYSIESGINDSMYFQVFNYGASTTTYSIITIPSQNYIGSTLAATLQSLLNTAFPSFFTVTNNINTNSISIAISGGNNTFKILTDKELAAGYWLGTINTSQPNSTNDVITNRTPYTNTMYSSWTSGMLNLLGFRAVYISSSNLSSFNVTGPQNEHDIIKKVITTSDFGYMIADQLVSDHDFLDCSRMTLSTIDFQIRDVKGNLIPFHDSPVSFTIIFSIKE